MAIRPVMRSIRQTTFPDNLHGLLTYELQHNVLARSERSCPRFNSPKLNGILTIFGSLRDHEVHSPQVNLVHATRSRPSEATRGGYSPAFAVDRIHSDNIRWSSTLPPTFLLAERRYTCFCELFPPLSHALKELLRAILLVGVSMTRKRELSPNPLLGCRSFLRRLQR